MGFLFVCYQDEEQTFKCFAGLIDKLFSSILGPDLSRIKLHFYQLDRLISIYLPELAEHFKVIHIYIKNVYL